MEVEDVIVREAAVEVAKPAAVETRKGEAVDSKRKELENRLLEEEAPCIRDGLIWLGWCGQRRAVWPAPSDACPPFWPH